MDYKRCLNCMEEIKTTQTCLKCGYDNASSIPESVLHLPPGTVLQDKYLIGKALGQGGFGITYLAWDLNLKLKLAVKEYLPQELAFRSGGQNEVSIYKESLAGNFNYGLEKFLEEARTLAQFNEHPNIVSVRDFYKANGTAYLVMNHIEGVTLKEYLADRGKPLTFDQALNIFIPVLDALKEVHAAGILHRDISPDNLLIDAKGRVVLIDFGAARQAMGDRSRSMSVIMKVGYSPLEQYQSKGKQGPWTDIYAVAATFYQAITGQIPPESMDRIDEDHLVSPSQLGVELKQNQEQALLKALAMRVEDRYQTVDAFQAELLVSGQDLKEEKTLAPSEERVRLNRDTNKQPSKEILHPANEKDYYQRQIANVKSDNSFFNIDKKLIGYSVPVIIIGLLLFVGFTLLAARGDEEDLAFPAKEEVEQGEADLNDENAIRDDSSNEKRPVEEIADVIENLNGNIANSGLVAHYKGYIYKSGEDRHIYKSELDGSERVKLNNNSSQNINIYDDWIYYTNLDDDRRIYSMRTDGSEVTKINDERSISLNMSGNWIYYIQTKELDEYPPGSEGVDLYGNIYQIRTDGSDRSEILGDEIATCLVLEEDFLYYGSNNGIYKMHIDGTNSKKLTDLPAFQIVIDEGWLYFVSDILGAGTYVGGETLYRINTKGDILEKVYSLEDTRSKWIHYFNVAEGRVYYVKKEHAKTIAIDLIDINTGNHYTLVDAEDDHTLTNINLVQDTLYYRVIKREDGARSFSLESIELH